MMHGGGGGGEREGEWEEIEKSLALLEPFLFSRGGGKWRAGGVREQGMDFFFFFQGFQ